MSTCYRAKACRGFVQTNLSSCCHPELVAVAMGTIGAPLAHCKSSIPRGVNLSSHNHGSCSSFQPEIHSRARTTIELSMPANTVPRYCMLCCRSLSVSFFNDKTSVSKHPSSPRRRLQQSASIAWDEGNYWKSFLNTRS